MINLYVFTVCMMVFAQAGAHLPDGGRLFPQPLVPIGSPLIDPMWTGPRMFTGVWDNSFGPQRHWPMNHFGQWPHTWNPHNTWNNGISTFENTGNTLSNNNGMVTTDPWEQYRRFSSGVRGLTDGTTNTISSQNQLTQAPVSNNFPWNTFATQTAPLNTFANQNTPMNTFANQNNPLNTFANQNTPLNTFANQNSPLNTFASQDTWSTAAVSNGLTQGFVNPQLQANTNNQFQTKPFLPQGLTFPNRQPRF